MKCKILIACFLMLFTSLILRAQNDQFQFSHLDINNGLSHNQVNAILKDSKGFMWFGTLSGLNKYDGYKFKVYKHSFNDTTTLNDDYIINLTEGPGNKIWVETRNGFNIYDPATEKFSHNITGYLNSIDIPGSKISALKKDSFGNFWFLHATKGVYKYNAAQHKTTHVIRVYADSASIYSNKVSDLSVDSKGNIWLVYSNGVLEQLNPVTNKVNYHLQLEKLPLGLNSSYKVYIDKQDDVWSYVPSYSSGVYYFNAQTKVLNHIDKGNGTTHLNTNVVASLIQDDKNRMWIATDHGGINLLNKQNFTIRYLLNREDDVKTVGQNSITVLYKDDTGIIWLGTYKRGLSYYHESIIKFPLYTHHASDPLSLPFSDINNFAEDKAGNIWLGTNGGGLVLFNPKNGTFKQYLHSTTNTNSLTNNVVVCMYIDHEQKLWIGTYFGGLDCYDGKTFTHYRHNDALPGSISEDRICAIREDADHNLWVGTLSGGLNMFNRKTQQFINYKSNGNNAENTVRSNYVSALMCDKDKNLWVVTSFGIDVLMYKTHRFVHYVHNDKDPRSIVNNNTNNILQDSRGLIWVSTRDGISIFNPATGKFSSIVKQDGLPDNTVIDIQEDEQHNMWVSTPNGLSNIIVSGAAGNLKFGFVNYTETEGLQGWEFTENSSYKTRSGQLIFGGGNGFNMFRPADIRSNKTVPKLVFTDFEVFNQSVRAGDTVNGKVILPKSITETQAVELRHNDNVFSIEFAALNYFNPDKIKLQYTMQGFDKGWITADNKIRKATYTNLDAGDYTFKVRPLNNEFWNSKEITLHVTILPPFWKTIWAYLLYAVVFIGALLYIRRRGIQKIRAQFSIEKEREEAQRMHDLDLMKIKFFTNVSHEFRTPLSLILAPVDKILKQMTDSDSRRQMLMINRNARRLLNLVNQLMDFRKMEYQELKLHKRPGDIINFIRDLSMSFTDVADQKGIRFVFDTDVKNFNTSFDHDKIERIMFNLLSNAYKFTHEGGQVSVLLSLKNQAGAGGRLLEIRVMDSGIGIPADKQDKVFEPFFQHDIPGSMLNQGSGIGLSITKEFVRLHDGEITLESEPDMGSCFTVLLPLQELTAELFTDAPLLLDHDDEFLNDTEPAKNNQPKENRDGKKATILLVEDNEDFRFYIKDNLKDAFNIIEAENGKKGWQKALAQHPNLIVSDISMPEMNGIDLCLKIRNDSRTSHIPVILLTALTGEEQQLKGLETGATDYMTKPFNFEILLSKIKNILNQQEDMRKTYQKQVDVKPTDEHIDSPEELFIKKVLLLIDNNISNPNFSVEELSSDMYVSRYTLYKKILQMTGKTPNELVRSMRLKRAAQLLETGHLTISQICHKVGFKSQKYFVRTFKAEFNSIPSKYLESVAEEED
ncbi:Signal transduction histidine kinase [Mucilaginibacter pineti]|uniref:histidine kinase n=1 Tax=Mucilaginibacter pineti TaxID=1391627 RepID=A0A1G7IZV5_9SPHI|nr:two-component regulator propeller domain-containing protein [Mucilaginibacter pineti]SDF18272.1 Signal transduction histidine kinase [Mucilaginibacter pineti]